MKRCVSKTAECSKNLCKMVLLLVAMVLLATFAKVAKVAKVEKVEKVLLLVATTTLLNIVFWPLSDPVPLC